MTRPSGSPPEGLQLTRSAVDTLLVSQLPNTDAVHIPPAPGTGGLGAITVIVFTILAYATLAGVLIAIDGLGRIAYGEPGTMRLIAGAALLAPAALVCVRSLRRRRLP